MADRLDPFLRRCAQQVRELLQRVQRLAVQWFERQQEGRILQRVGSFIGRLQQRKEHRVFRSAADRVPRVDDNLIRIVLETAGTPGALRTLRPILPHAVAHERRQFEHGPACSAARFSSCCSSLLNCAASATRTRS